MDRLGPMMEALRDVVAAPGENAGPALLLLGMVIVLLVMVLVIVLLVVAYRAERRRRRRMRILEIRRQRLTAQTDGEATAEPGAAVESPPAATPAPAARDASARPVVARRVVLAEKAPRPPRRMDARGRALNLALTVWMPALIVVAIAVAGWAYSSRDAACATYCHGSDPVTRTRAKTDHARVGCVACHEDGGATGLPAAVSARVRFVLVKVGAVPTGSVDPAPVPSRRCLGCHAEQIADTIDDEVRTIRMRHTEPLAAGMACADCHFAAGHEASAAPVPMTRCVTCHDDDRAPADCELCHIEDTSEAARGRRLFSKANVRVVADCDGCHDQHSCDTCHGLRLPHPDAFVGGGHAREAAFAGKRACFRCHTQDSCARCHQVPMTVDPGKPWGHPADWRAAHARAPRDSMCSCHQGRRPQGRRGQPFCTACH